MIKLHKSKDNQYYFTVCGKNGKVIVTSETYKTPRNLLRGVKALKTSMIEPIEVKDLTIK